MNKKYFGTDGIRGKVGELPITPELVMHLGYAAGRVLVSRKKLSRGERPAVLIGKDTRISGYMLESALEAGFSAAGVDVWLTGPMPTPAIAYLTRALRLQAGIVISASHNPFDDNGIKFFSAEGTKLPDAVEQEIEQELTQPIRCLPSAKLGKARRVDDAPGRYIEFCKSAFPNELDLRGLKIVVDCAHGATYHLAPAVFHELGADVIAKGVEPDGLNINHNLGATHPAFLIEAVTKNKADLGVAFDGDGDRVVMVDSQGAIYDGDQLLYVIAKHRHKLIQQSKATDFKGVVGTLMTNLAFEHVLQTLNIPFARAAVGDRYVLEMMQQKGWQLGGENSGHIICLDKHTTGDGIISALQVLTALRMENATLTDYARELTLYPQVLINVTLPKGFQWRDHSAIEKAQQQAEKELGDQGRILLRASGTEPVLRVMVEGKDQANVERLAQKITSTVEDACRNGKEVSR